MAKGKKGNSKNKTQTPSSSSIASATPDSEEVSTAKIESLKATVKGRIQKKAKPEGTIVDPFDPEHPHIKGLSLKRRNSTGGIPESVSARRSAGNDFDASLRDVQQISPSKGPSNKNKKRLRKTLGGGSDDERDNISISSHASRLSSTTPSVFSSERAIEFEETLIGPSVPPYVRANRNRSISNNIDNLFDEPEDNVIEIDHENGLIDYDVNKLDSSFVGYSEEAHLEEVTTPLNARYLPHMADFFKEMSREGIASTEILKLLCAKHLEDRNTVATFLGHVDSMEERAVWHSDYRAIKCLPSWRTGEQLRRSSDRFHYSLVDGRIMMDHMQSFFEKGMFDILESFVGKYDILLSVQDKANSEIQNVALCYLRLAEHIRAYNRQRQLHAIARNENLRDSDSAEEVVPDIRHG